MDYSSFITTNIEVTLATTRVARIKLVIIRFVDFGGVIINY